MKWLLRLLNRVQRKIANFLLIPFNAWAYKYYYNYPFGNLPKATGDEYYSLWNQAKKQTYEVIDQFEISNDAIDSEWFHNIGLLTQIYSGQKGVLAINMEECFIQHFPII